MRLDSARVRPVIGKLVATGMAQHLGMNRMIESGLDAGPCHQLGDAKSKPGSVSFAPVGAGTLPHLVGVLFERRAGIQLLHVPFPGSPQAVTDVMAGRVTMFFAPASSSIGQVTSGKVLALATAGDKRSSALPKVPTMAKAGMPYFDTSLWLGLTAPAGLSRPVIDKLSGCATARPPASS